MGAYLIFKLINPKEAIKANDWLEQQEEQKELKKFHRGLWFWDSRDRAIELKRLRETGAGCPDYRKIGEGDWKASGLSEEEEPCYNLVVKLFEKLHENFEIKVYSGSCALDEFYFNKEQIKILTKNGTALSGQHKEEVLKLIEVEIQMELKKLRDLEFWQTTDVLIVRAGNIRYAKRKAIFSYILKLHLVKWISAGKDIKEFFGLSEEVINELKDKDVVYRSKV